MKVVVGEADVERDGLAVLAEFLVGPVLVGVIEHDDGVDVAAMGELADGVVHEDAAAVGGGADGVGGEEKNAGAGGAGVEFGEAVVEVSGGGDAEDFGVGNLGEGLGAPAGNDGFRDMREGAEDAGDAGAGGLIARPGRHDGTGLGEEEMGGEAGPGVDVFPAEDEEVFLEDGIDEILGEFLADGAAVFMVDDAGGLIVNLPAALPCQVADVGVFEVEGGEEVVEAAEGEEFVAMEGAGTAAAVEAGEESVDVFVFAMADAEAAIGPPALRETGFFAAFGFVAQEDLTAYGEDGWVGIARIGAEAIKEGLKKIGFDAHVAVEQDDDVVFSGAEAGVGAAAEAEVFGKGEEVDFGVVGADPFGAAVGGAVIDDEDFAAGVVANGFEPGGEEADEEVFTVPVGDDEGCGAEIGSDVVVGDDGFVAAAGEEPEEVCKNEGGEAEE